MPLTRMALDAEIIGDRNGVNKIFEVTSAGAYGAASLRVFYNGDLQNPPWWTERQDLGAGFFETEFALRAGSLLGAHYRSTEDTGPEKIVTTLSGTLSLVENLSGSLGRVELTAALVLVQPLAASLAPLGLSGVLELVQRLTGRIGEACDVPTEAYIEIIRGSDLTVRVTITDESNAPIDLTDHSIFCDVRDDCCETANLLIRKTTGDIAQIEILTQDVPAPAGTLGQADIKFQGVDTAGTGVNDIQASRNYFSVWVELPLSAGRGAAISPSPFVVVNRVTIVP